MSLRGPLRVGVGGPVGSGKTALVEGLARRIVLGDVPSSLKGATVYSLDVRDALPDATRVVFVSGYMRSDLPTISRCADVDEYLTKPFPPDELARVVVRLTAAPALGAAHDPAS